MSNDTRQKLESFNLQVNKLKPYYDSFKNLELKLEYGEDAGKMQQTGPIEEHLVTILMHFRPLYMKDSSISFHVLAEAVLADSEYDTYHEKTRTFLNAWERLLNKEIANFGGITLGINGSELSPRKIFDIWLNEAYFHPENYKKGSGKGLDMLKSNGVAEGMSRFFMISLLQQLCLCALAFNHQVIEVILE